MKKILIIDDQPNSVEPIKMLFEQEGYAPKIVSNHAGIFNEIDDFKPDLILLDVILQGSDGRYICELLKSLGRTKHIPIILISGITDAQSILHGGTLADGFMRKPFDLDESMERVRALLAD